MYPLTAVLIGCNDSELTELRCEFENLAVSVEGGPSKIDDAFIRRTAATVTNCFFLMRVRAPEDLDGMRRIVRHFSGKPIVGLMNSDSNTNAILQTLRAGAAQIVLYPLKTEDLQSTLKTLAVQFGFETKTTKVIAISGVTEGCGATSLAINLGFEISSAYKRKCILAELAIHCGRLATDMNLELSLSINDLLAGLGPLNIVTIKQALVKVTSDFHVLAGPSQAICSAPIASQRIAELIERLRPMTDVALLDVPAMFDDTYFDTLAHADRIVLVGQQSVRSVHDMQLVKSAIKQRGCLAQTLAVVSQFDASDLTFNYAYLVKVLNTDDFLTVSSDPAAFRLCLNSGTPLHEVAPRSPALIDIHKIADFLLTGKRSDPSHDLGTAHRGWLARIFG